MQIDDSVFPCIMTALLVGNIAAMTLTVSGIKSMYELANNAFKAKKRKVDNDRIYHLEFGVLEHTHRVTLIFGASETFALVYILLRIFADNPSDMHRFDLVLIICIVALLAGVIATIWLYTDLQSKGLHRNKLDTSDFSSLYHNS